MFMGCKITSSVARGGGILPNPQARNTESGRLGFGVVVSMGLMLCGEWGRDRTNGVLTLESLGREPA